MHIGMIGSIEFTYGVIDNPELLQEAFRLRYRVYCHECNFIKEEDYPEGFEKDEYDPYSIEFFAKDSEGLIGTARLILDSPLGFPLEEHCKNNLFIDKNALPRKNCAEISRLVISKEYRRRINDGMYYSPDYIDNQEAAAKKNLIKRIKPMTFGIFKEMYQTSKRRDIKYWYALMEKSLYLLLKIHGFVFDPIGSEIDFYGLVKPYLVNIEELEKSVKQKLPNLFKYFTSDLEPKYVP